MAKQMTREKFLEKCIKTHGLKYDYSKTVYSGSHKNIIVICPIHGEFQQDATVHKSGGGCQKCSNCYSKTQEEFINECNKIHNNKYDYSLVDYKNTKTKIKIICPIDNHGTFEQSASHHIHKKQGCPKCKLITIKEKLTITLNEFITRSNKVHKNKYNYSITKFVKLNANVEIICPVKDHGIFIQRANHHIMGAGCPLCSMSRSEKAIKHFLEQNKIEFEMQKTFDTCKNPNTNRKLKFDFYLTDINVLIEYDGMLHYKARRDMPKTAEHVKNTKYKDIIKNDWCERNNVKLFRIPYFEKKNLFLILINILKEYNIPIIYQGEKIFLK